MGIEKTGRGAGAPEVPAADGAGAPQGAGPVARTFGEVHAEKATRAAPADASSPLDRLRAGTIDLDGYVEARLDAAMAGLRGVGAQQRDAIRSVLREQILTDPTLIDLVQRATGQIPKAPDE